MFLKDFQQKIRSTINWPVLLVSTIWIVICFVNYRPGTWLIGWDNLLPELNFGLNIHRSLFAGWQEFQGLGLAGGMGHAAEISRQLILWLSSLFLPQSFLRYAWTFAMLLLGPLGVYKVLNFLFVKQTNSETAILTQIPSFLGSLFYLCNIATVQYFYVPLETFSSFYGFFPWLIFFSMRYLQNGKKGDLIRYFALSLLATSAFHVQTLFIVYFICLVVLCFENALRCQSFTRSLKLIVTTLIANAFWLLPVIYFTLTSGNITVLSKQSLISTPESQLLNQNFGTLFNIAQLKGYWLNYSDVKEDGSSYYLLGVWRDHANSILFTSYAIISFIIAVAGLVLSLIKNRYYWLMSFGIIGVISVMMLSSGNGIIGYSFALLDKLIPFFGQMFRVAFTKWSIVTAFTHSIGIGLFFALILNSSLLRKKKLCTFSISFFISILILVSIHPLFTGNLFYDKVRLKLPEEYFELFDFLHEQPHQARIVHLPLATFWGWNFYDWGYRGSGFLWYGIEQPILDRNFDVWSLNNEAFYDEFSVALKGKDPVEVNRILSKYNVSYLLLDEHIFLPGNTNATDIEGTISLLEAASATKLWNNKALSLFKFNDTNFLAQPQEYVISYQADDGSTTDTIYKKYGNYITLRDSISSQVMHPFSKLAKSEISVERKNQNQIEVSSASKLELTDKPNYFLSFGGDYTTYIPATISLKSQNIIIQFGERYRIYLDNAEFLSPTLPDQSLILDSSISGDLVVQINDTQVELKDGESKPLSLFLQVNKPIIISYFDKANTELSDDGKSYIYSQDVKEITIPSSAWDSFNELYPITSGSHSTLRAIIYVPKTIVPIDVLTYSNNCDVFERGQISSNIESNGVVYSAKSYGANCNGISLESVQTKGNYVINIKGTNLKGRSLKWFIQNNASKNADIEVLLNVGTFDSWFGLKSWQKLPSSNYYMNWETRSFGEQESLNRLESIEISPFPLEELINVYIQNSETVQPVKNTISIQKHHKIGNYFYALDIISSSKNDLLVLSQGFHQGWLAIRLPNSITNISELTFFKHVTFNDWANAWIVTPGNYTVLVIYWPQFFIFLGLVMLVALVIILLPKKSLYRVRE